MGKSFAGGGFMGVGVLCPHLGGQPIHNLLALLPHLHLDASAVLGAFSIGGAEQVQKLVKLYHIHNIGDHILCDIGNAGACYICHILGDDFLEVLAFAQVRTHKGKALSLYAHMVLRNVATLVIWYLVMGTHFTSESECQSLLGMGAKIGIGAFDGSGVDSIHNKIPLS